MAPYVGTHMTHKRNLGAIKRWGLIPRKTAEHNYKSESSYLRDQPTGVFTMQAGAREWWGSLNDRRALEVSYIGPMMDDPILGPDSIVLLDRVPPENIRIVKA